MSKTSFFTKRSKCLYGDQYDPRERKHNDAGEGRDNCSQNIVVFKKKKKRNDRETKGELSFAKDTGQQKYALMYTWTYFQGKNRDAGMDGGHGGESRGWGTLGDQA